MYNVLPKDNNTNVIKGSHIGIKTIYLMIIGGNRLISTVGLDGFIIRDTDDVLPICPGPIEQKVREYKINLEKQGKLFNII